MIDKDLAAKLRLNLNEMHAAREEVESSGEMPPTEKLRNLIIQEILTRELINALLRMSIARLTVVHNSMFQTDSNKHDISLVVQNLRNILDFVK